MARGRPPRTVPLVVVLVALAAPHTAAAQEPGVTVDPDSPSGRQYAIPLDDARSTGTDDGRSTRGGANGPTDDGAGGDSGLFGAGIDDRAAAGGGSKADGGASARGGAPAAGADLADDGRDPSASAPSGSTDERDPTTPNDGSSRPTRGATEAAVGRPTDGGAGTTPVLLALGALAVAGAAGLVARRATRNRRTTP